MLGASESLVVLRGGFSTPEAVYRLLLDLEGLGVSIAREGGVVTIRPFSRLTPAHREVIVRRKADIVALLDYITRPDLDAHLFTDDGRCQESARFPTS